MSDPGKLLLDAVRELHKEMTMLPEGATTLQEVMKELDISYDKARVYLNRLIEEGKVERVRRGRNQHHFVFKE